MRSRILIAFAAGLLSVTLLHFVRQYPWDLALISGVLLAGLTFVTLQTVVRLRTTLSQFKRN